MTSKIIYTGNLRTSNTHLKSGTEIITDAPVDNHGLGQSFSPTDLVATAAANCMLTIAGIRANKHGFIIDNSYAEVEKIMASNPRKIGQLNINVHFPAALSEDERSIAEHAALNCPVMLSLSEQIKKNVTFFYDLDQ